MKNKKRSLFPIVIHPPWTGLIVIFLMLLVCVGVYIISASIELPPSLGENP